MTLIEYVCQDVLNIIRFGVLIGNKVHCRSVLGLYNILDGKVRQVPRPKLKELDLDPSWRNLDLDAS